MGTPTACGPALALVVERASRLGLADAVDVGPRHGKSTALVRLPGLGPLHRAEAPLNRARSAKAGVVLLGLRDRFRRERLSLRAEAGVQQVVEPPK